MPLLPDAHGVYLADVRPDRWWRRALHRLVSRLSRRFDDAWDDVGSIDDEPTTTCQVIQAHEAPFYAAVDAKAEPIREAFITAFHGAVEGLEWRDPEPVDAETYRLLTGRDARADVAANQLSAAVDDAHQLYAFLVRDVGHVAAFQHAKALADLRRRWGL